VNKNKKLNESTKVFLSHITEAGKKCDAAGAKCREAAERLSATMQKLICPTKEGRKALKLHGIDNDIEKMQFVCNKCKQENTEFVYTFDKTCKCGGEIEAIVLLTGKVRKIEISGEIIL